MCIRDRQGTRVFVDTNSNFTYNATSESHTFGDLTTGTGSKNEYLISQDAICLGAIDAIVGVDVDSVWIHPSETAEDETEIRNTSRVSIYGPSTYSPNAANNSNLRSESASFVDYTNSTNIFRLNRQEPQFSGIPTVDYYIRGRTIRTLNAEGTAFDSTSFSNNAIEVLLDYLTSSIYGPGWVDSDIDMLSLIHI